MEVCAADGRQSNLDNHLAISRRGNRPFFERDAPLVYGRREIAYRSSVWLCLRPCRCSASALRLPSHLAAQLVHQKHYSAGGSRHL
jgi:hypothetical protein